MIQRIFKASIVFSIFINSWIGVYNLINSSPKIKGISTDISSSEIISLTNIVRLNQDVSTLKPNQTLNNAAENKAKDMIEKNYFSHTDSQGNGPWKFIDQSEYIYQYAGENLARNFKSSEQVVDAWLRSEEHRNNMLNPLYNDIGVAVVETKEDIVIVQLLASEIPSNLVEQYKNYQKDFVFTTPITGKQRKINPNLTLTFISMFITLSSFIAFFTIAKLLNNQKPSFKSPNPRHWKNK